MLYYTVILNNAKFQQIHHRKEVFQPCDSKTTEQHIFLFLNLAANSSIEI